MRDNTTRVPLFVEGCAGTGALSLALQFGLGCRPPVSRLGAKTGYALALLRVLGLRPGQGADAFVLAEPDLGCRALLHAYTDPALMRAAADIIRSWASEDPRALWERLRAEGPIRDFGAREVGRGIILPTWAFRQGVVESGFNPNTAYDTPIRSSDGREDVFRGVTAEKIADKASELARWLQVQASNRPINVGAETMANTGKGGTTFGGEEFATPAEKVADAAREVARHAYVAAQSWKGEGKHFAEQDPSRGAGVHQHERVQNGELVARMDTAGLPATIVPDIREIDPAGCPVGTVAYFDFPYLGDGSQKITGYGHDLTLQDQIDIARRWDAAGAVVAVSECVSRVADFGGEGWWGVDITDTRVGQRRTFSTALGRTEWLTLNREPSWTPAIQQALF